MRTLSIIFAILTMMALPAVGEESTARYDNIPIANPVYSFLERAEAKGLIEGMSLAIRPVTRMEVIKMLKIIRKNESRLSQADLSVLEKYERYFEIIKEEKLVVFYSKDDTSQVLSRRFFDDNPKYVYHYEKGESNVYVSPLFSLDNMAVGTDNAQGKQMKNALFTNYGFRINGTLGGMVGYHLDATNGGVLAGDRNALWYDEHISSNVKFNALNSDFDFMESGVNLKYKNLFVGISKESRKWGSGINHSLYVSNYAPAFTSLNIGVELGLIHYLFTHGSLLTHYRDSASFGFNATLPSKYLTTHRLAIRPSWGEFALWEGIVYSNRGIDMNYLNPLTFLKSLEHSLRDRDNSIMGFDFVVRPIDNLEFKGTFILDDIIFSEIGKDFWSNKYAWNIAMWYSPKLPMDFGLEYIRIEPYTFSHFNYLNNYTHDSRAINTNLQPNSDQIAAMYRLWWGQKMPLELKLAYTRHGDNTYDKDGKVIHNVGGDIEHTRYWEDSDRVKFLDGIRNDYMTIQVGAGYEFFRDFMIKASYSFIKGERSGDLHILRLGLQYENF